MKSEAGAFAPLSSTFDTCPRVSGRIRVIYLDNWKKKQQVWSHCPLTLQAVEQSGGLLLGTHKNRGMRGGTRSRRGRRGG